MKELDLLSIKNIIVYEYYIVVSFFNCCRREYM